MNLQGGSRFLVDRIELLLLDRAGLHRAILEDRDEISALDVCVADALIDDLTAIQLLLHQVHV